MRDFPDFYDPHQVGTLFYPDMAQIAAAAKAARLLPATSDQTCTHLVIIDRQIDFCHGEGSLYVPGALEDLQRLIEFIYTQAENISKITCTVDSHLPFQIFHSSWWINGVERRPHPLTIITVDDPDEGEWQSAVLRENSVSYGPGLEEETKKEVTIWPYHPLAGSLGNVLDPSLWSAVMWHSLARQTQPGWLPKGVMPQTKQNSAVEEDQSQAGIHQGFLDNLAQADVILVAGEAESHCVLETLGDIIAEFQDERDQLEKIYVLQDCMSPVLHPIIDFHKMAMKQFKEWEAAGIHFINSTDPLPFLKSSFEERTKWVGPLMSKVFRDEGEFSWINQPKHN